MSDGDPTDSLAAQIARWASESAADAAAGARARQRWLRQQNQESATLEGTLVDLAERAAPVHLSTVAGTISGTLTAVGTDFCIVTGSATTIVARHAVVAVTAVGTVAAVSVADGDRPAALQLTLLAALEMLAADRPPVRLSLSGGNTLGGTLVSVGIDIVSVQTDASPKRSTAIAIDHIATCTLL